MFVQDDFKHLKLKTCNKLQYFANENIKENKHKGHSNKNEESFWQYFMEMLDEFVYYFCMHGMDRIFKRNLNPFKRMTWIIGISMCFWIFLYVSFKMANTYYRNPLVTVVSATRYPIFRIPFPEVIICNRNRFNWQRFGLAKKIFLKPEHQILAKYEHIFMEVVSAFDTLSFGKFYKFQNLSQLISPALLQELSYINFQAVADFMAWRCHEIFSLCKWLNEYHNCCEIFFLRNSQLGSCLAFNSIESPEGLEKQRLDPFWPWRTKDRGTYNGLHLRIHLREEDHSPKYRNKKGILVMLNEPTVWFSTPIEIDTHTQAWISIKAILHTYSDYTRILSSKVRQCLFQNELENVYYRSLPNRPYMFENCRSQCQQEQLIKFCNCTFSNFYPPGPHKSCKLVDYPCLYYNNGKFLHFEASNEMESISKHISDAVNCVCLYNCKSLIYTATVTTASMTNIGMNINNSYIDLNVFFQKEFLMVFLTTVLYTLTDLMAGFGGLASLCIGCSLLNWVEIAYFIIIDIPSKSLKYYRKKKYLKWQNKSRTAKVVVIENFMRN